MTEQNNHWIIDALAINCDQNNDGTFGYSFNEMVKDGPFSSFSNQKFISRESALEAMLNTLEELRPGTKS